MKEILSVENMRQSDAHTIATEVPSLELMYRAGKAVADSVEWRAPVGIVCGVGNNAGDGYVIALELKKRGIRLAVLSNKPDKLVKMIVNNIFPDRIISESMGQTDLPKKPDPTVPLMIAKGFGVAPADTYFIGDSEVDVLTGKNARMITLAVSWGFRDRAVLEEAKPDFLFDTREELLTYFRNITN